MNPAELYRAGLIQVGYFNEGHQVSLIRWQFEILPSYPVLMQDVAQLTAEVLKPHKTINRIVCDSHSSALGGVVSVNLGIPMVYHAGHDFIGAYDVGHPACLLVNQIEAEPVARIIRQAERVGLDIKLIIEMVEGEQSFNGVDVVAVFRKEQLLAALAESGVQLAVVRDYLAGRAG